MKLFTSSEMNLGERLRSDRGSALIMAIFVLVLLTSMGTALLFMSSTELGMSQANLRNKEAFYLAEAGLEAARSELWDVNRATDFSDDLVTTTGPDGSLDFDVTTIDVIRDSAGTITGFTGHNDDVPLVSRKFATARGIGAYAAFLTNDPVELLGASPLTDGDGRVMLTSIGGGPDGSVEIVQAIIELHEALPSLPPSTITLLGPSPVFAGAKSKTKDYTGDDCGVTGGLYVPIIGTVDGEITSGIETNPDYDSGPYTDYGTTTDLTDPTDPILAGPGFPDTIDTDWQDCAYLDEMLQTLSVTADYSCSGHSCTIPAGPADQIVFVSGDYSFDQNDSGAGTLVVTGEMTANGRFSWAGLILVIGEGQWQQNGSGNGTISGGVVVVDIAGPDNVYGTADDCGGPDNGFDSVTYDEAGGGNAGSIFCTSDIIQSNPAEPYEIVEFLQR